MPIPEPGQKLTRRGRGIRCTEEFKTEVFSLHREGMSIAQIARRLESSHGTVSYALELAEEDAEYAEVTGDGTGGR